MLLRLNYACILKWDLHVHNRLSFSFYPLLPRIVVIEKTSPPVPVAVAPEASTSSASQVIAPTQVTGRCDVYVI